MLNVGPSQHRVLMRASADEVTFMTWNKGKAICPSSIYPSIHLDGH